MHFFSTAVCESGFASVTENGATRTAKSNTRETTKAYWEYTFLIQDDQEDRELICNYANPRSNVRECL
jgi:hypothetical protein